MSQKWVQNPSSQYPIVLHFPPVDMTAIAGVAQNSDHAHPCSPLLRLDQELLSSEEGIGNSRRAYWGHVCAVIRLWIGQGPKSGLSR